MSTMPKTETKVPLRQLEKFLPSTARVTLILLSLGFYNIYGAVLTNNLKQYKSQLQNRISLSLLFSEDSKNKSQGIRKRWPRKFGASDHKHIVKQRNLFFQHQSITISRSASPSPSASSPIPINSRSPVSWTTLDIETVSHHTTPSDFIVML